MSRFKYNGVELSNVLTSSIEVVPVRDDTNSVYLYTEYRVRVTGLINRTTDPDTPAALPPLQLDGSSAETLSGGFARIEEKLRLSNRSFLYSPDAGQMISVPGDPDVFVTDDRNGPRVDGMTLTRLTDTTASVDIAVTVCKRSVCPDNPSQTDFLAHRWTETCEVMADWRTRKTRTGDLFLPTGIDPDNYRAEVTPQVEPGFFREVARYTIHPDGLRCSFQFVDVELMRPAPAPVLRLYGRQSQSSPMGAVRKGHISLRAVGARQTAKSAMMSVLICYAMDRVYAAGVQEVGKGRPMIRNSVFWESLDDDKNEVGLELEWTAVPPKGRATANGQFTKMLAEFLVGATVSGSVGGTAAAIGSDQSAAALANGGAAGLLAQQAAQVNAQTDATPAGNPTPQPNAQGKEQAAVPVDLAWLDRAVPAANKDRGIAPPTRGTADAVKVAAKILNDPCGQSAALQTEPGVNLWRGISDNGITVTVSESSGSLLDSLADDYEGLYEGDGIPGVYDDYSVTNHVTSDPGTVVLPSTKPGEPGQVVRLRNPTIRMRSEWHVKRTGGPPVIPEVYQAASSGSNEWEFVKGTISLEMMDVAADGVTPVYEAAGVFDFVAKDPSRVSVAAPVPPYLNNSLAAQAVAPVVRSPNVVFPASTSGAGTNPFVGPDGTPTQPTNTPGPPSVPANPGTESPGSGDAAGPPDPQP